MNNNIYNQANPINDYYKQSRKDDMKNFFKNIIWLIIALVHRFVGYPYFSNLLENFLNKKGLNDNLVSIILFAYLAISVLFVIIRGWKVVRDIKIINFLYIIASLAFIGYFGYNYFMTSGLYDKIFNNPLASFVIEAKELCNNAKIYWQKETITYGNSKTTYIKSNSEYCNNKRLAYVDKNTEYYITVDINGNITDFRITNGRFQYTYEGNNLNVNDIKSDKFVKVEDNNKIIIPSCPSK